LKRIGLHPVKFLYSTPGREEQSVRDSARELKSKGISVLVGGSLSREGVIIMEEFGGTDIPVWGITTSTSALSGIRDNFFRIVSPADIMGKGFGNILSVKDYSNILFVKSSFNRNYSDPYADAFSEAFSGNVREVYYEEGWSDSLTEEIEAIVCVMSASELIQVIRLTRKTAPNVKIFSSDWGFDELPTLFSGPELEGIYSLTRRGPLEKQYEEIFKEFSKTLNFQPTYGAITVFATLDIIKKNLEKTGNNRTKLIKEFQTPQFLNSGYGKAYLNEYGDAVPENLYFRQIQNGKVTLLETIKFSKE